MRLSTSEVQGINQALDSFLDKSEAKLFLFGSRVDDQKKGGDIDLLLVVPSEALIGTLREKKHVLLSEIKKRIGDRKIDLKIALPDDLKTDAFLKVVQKKILLKKW